MKKKFFAYVVVAIMLLITSTHALSLQRTTFAPSLSFSDGNAICTFRVVSPGDDISISMTLWEGNKKIDSWSKSGKSSILISESTPAEKGHTYILKITGTIGSKALSGIQREGTYN